MQRPKIGVQAGILAAVTFVGGLVVGGVGPRGQVRELERQVFELERARSRSGGGSAAGRELAELITRGIDEARPAGFQARPAAPTPRTDTDRAAEDGDDAVELELPPAEPGAPDDDPLTAAREMLAVRTAQARAALLEDAAPTDGQLDRIDATYAAMNDELLTIARDLVQAVNASGEPSRRDMMAIGADVLDVLVRTEEDVLGVLSEEQRAEVREESTDPTSYVDASVIDVLMELQDFEP